MRYKEVTAKGHLVFLGVDLRWIPTKGKGWKFVTGMHFRDFDYPITIRRYPAGGSMVTDAQRLGVITGQLVRAQRTCSIEAEFKAAVQNIALAAFRRGYKRGELDRIWGKFLVSWWKAQEERKGQLRSWFRKMTAWAKEEVRKETELMQREEKAAWCKFGKRCLKLREGSCPHLHWEQADKVSRRPGLGPVDMNVDQPERPLSGGEMIPKEAAKVWKAVGDGACLFYSVLQANDKQAVWALKGRLACYVREHRGTDALRDGRTVQQLVELVAPGVEEYIGRLMQDSYQGDELELTLLAIVQKLSLHVYRDGGDCWLLKQVYGAEGPVHRLAYTGRHYDVLLPKESWQRETELITIERRRASKAGHALEPRDAVKEVTAHPEGSARRKGAWRSSQEDRRVRQVAALRDAEQPFQVEDMLSLTPEMVALLEGLSAQAGVDPTLWSLQLEEEAMRSALGIWEECCVGMLGSWVHWRATHPELVQHHQRRVSPATHSKREPVKETTIQTGASKRKENWQGHQEGRRQSQVAAHREGSQQPPLEMVAPQGTEPPGIGGQETQPTQGPAKLYCRCQSRHSSKEYWIQCTCCEDWFHPRCIGKSRQQCEEERAEGGFVCPDCMP